MNALRAPDQALSAPGSQSYLSNIIFATLRVACSHGLIRAERVCSIATALPRFFALFLVAGTSLGLPRYVLASGESPTLSNADLLSQIQSASKGRSWVAQVTNAERCDAILHAAQSEHLRPLEPNARGLTSASPGLKNVFVCDAATKPDDKPRYRGLADSEPWISEVARDIRIYSNINDAVTWVSWGANLVASELSGFAAFDKKDCRLRQQKYGYTPYQVLGPNGIPEVVPGTLFTVAVLDAHPYVIGLTAQNASSRILDVQDLRSADGAAICTFISNGR